VAVELERELFLPLRSTLQNIVPAHHVRGTLLLSSLSTLQCKGLLDRYYERLEPVFQGQIRSIVAGEWLPIKIGMAHYQACEALGLSRAEQMDLGRGVGQKQDKIIFNSMLALAKKAGVTPWTPLSLLHKIQDRVIQGGDIAVYKLSPKDARLEVHRVPFLQFEYVQTAYCGMFKNTAEYFCRRAYMKVHEATALKTTFLLSWA
jgi:hypothetical protein